MIGDFSGTSLVSNDITRTDHSMHDHMSEETAMETTAKRKRNENPEKTEPSPEFVKVTQIG